MMASSSFRPGTPAAGRAVGSARRPRGWWATLRWYVRGVLGEDVYDAYVAHRAATHPEGPVLSEREYWRARTDWQEKNPQGRCC
ncbi:hypothetical protein BKD30_11430 [Tersicoccus phoenicis]|uniref:DUF466 domain-containing protein n=2 Tax=Tersicoccus phoenicis TaxID=554083 RepID=A0A1R1L816_9MICC|nr:hypothetical protein BKD30_11430 [Tersicoccus phoenicis]